MPNRGVVFAGQGVLAVGGSFALFQAAIIQWLGTHGWAIHVNVSSANQDGVIWIQVTTAVDCSITDLNSLAYQLSQTVLGSRLADGTICFSSVNLAPANILNGNCGEPVGNPTGGGGGQTGNGTYTVVAGDTLSRIAARFGMSLAALLALNPQIHNANLLSVGQVINISGTPHQATVPIITNINPNTGVATVIHSPTASNPPTVNASNWFDRTFFTGAGALTGVGIGVLVVLGAVVVTRNR